MRLVIFPQALRVIIPPLTSQYLNLTKNSSLAIAIGYPDIYFVASTTFNQTGKAVEVMLLIMITYLTLSLIISLTMNLFNRSVQIKER
jgi:general L-amino acid transport system permease protein